MLLTVIVFFITLSVLIFVHELGHFWAAKKAGVKVEEFGFGYPPRILGKKIGETIYSINWIPFGGFVKLYGEELIERRGKPSGIWDRAFWAKSKKARTMVVLAGVLANFLLAVVAFSIVYSAAGIPTKTDQVRIVGIAPDSPADRIGLEEGDIVLKVDNQRLSGLSHFTQLVREKKGEEIKLEIMRTVNDQQSTINYQLIPREHPPEKEGPLGVVVSNIEMKKHPFWQMPFRGTIEGFKEAFGWTALIFRSLGKMIVDLFWQGKVPRDIAGPVGIFQISAGVARSGFLAVLQFIGILSVNLAVINVLPFPALDGGRLVFIVYEAITRRRPKPSFERWVNTLGMAILIFLLILVTISDLNRLFQ